MREAENFKEVLKVLEQFYGESMWNTSVAEKIAGIYGEPLGTSDIRSEGLPFDVAG